MEVDWDMGLVEVRFKRMNVMGFRVLDLVLKKLDE